MMKFDLTAQYNNTVLITVSYILLNYKNYVIYVIVYIYYNLAPIASKPNPYKFFLKVNELTIFTLISYDRSITSYCIAAY